MQPAQEGWGATEGINATPVIFGRLGQAWRWLAANFIAERERWALWLPVFVGAGVGIYFWLTVEPPLWLGPLAAALTTPLAVAAYRRQRGVIPALAAAAVTFGF